MNTVFYTKTTDFKLFGIPIFSKQTIYNETEHDTDFDIIVKPDYYKAEFENGKDTEKKENT